MYSLEMFSLLDVKPVPRNIMIHHRALSAANRNISAVPCQNRPKDLGHCHTNEWFQPSQAFFWYDTNYRIVPFYRPFEVKCAPCN